MLPGYLCVLCRHMTRLSLEQRYRIAASFQQTHSIQRTARECGVSKKAARLWIKRHSHGEELVNKKPLGRPPSMSVKACATAVDLLHQQSVGTSQGVATQLYASGITSTELHRTTVIRHAKKYAKATGPPLCAYTGLPPKGLTTANKTKRAQFAEENRGTDWSRVMFTDRCRFYLTHPGVCVRHVVWARVGQRERALSVNHAMGVNVYMGIMQQGVTRPICVTGTYGMRSSFKNNRGQPARNVTTAEHKYVLEHGLLHDGEQCFVHKGIHD